MSRTPFAGSRFRWFCLAGKDPRLQSRISIRPRGNRHEWRMLRRRDPTNCEERLHDRLLKTRTILISEPVSSAVDPEGPAGPPRPRGRGSQGAGEGPHQLAGRGGRRRLRHLRHDAVHPVPRHEHLRRPRSQRGDDHPARRRSRAAVRPAEHPPPPPPAVESMQGVASDIAISAREVLRIRERINRILSRRPVSPSRRSSMT